MPSTYTTNNGIELIATGEQSGTWGSTTNTNLELLDASLDGQVTVTLASTGTSGSPNTLPISDGSASNGRNRLVIFNDGSDLGGTAYVQLTPNDAEKIIYVRNSLSGSRSILLFQGTYNASNDYEVPAGTTAVIYFDGAGSGAVAANVFNNAFFDSLRLGSVSVDKILDQDDMSGDDASALATQQSIKAYVDSQVAGSDTLTEVLANGNTTSGRNIQMTTTDELQFRDTALKISSSADGQLDIDADTEIEIVAPTLDIDASTAVTIDTTTLTMTGSVNVVGDLDVDNININGNTVSSTDTNGDINLSPNGTGTVVINTDLDVDNININGNTIISTDTNGNIALTPNGTGEVDISKVDIDGGAIDGVTIGTNSAVTDLRVDNLKADGNTISSTDTNGDVNISPNGTGTVVINTDLDVDNININGNTISSTDTNGNIALTPNGSGEVDISKVDIDAGSIDGVTLGTNSAVTEAQVDNININGNTISSTDTNGNIALTPNGTGEVDISKVDIASGEIDGVTIGTNSAVTDLRVDNIKVDGNTISSTDTNGNIALTPNGTGEVDISKVDIDAGTIDGVTIGGASAGAGTFTTATATTVNATTVDSTNVEVTNIKAKDGTASATIADSTGVMTIASSVLTTVDINGGTIDGTAIGGSTAAAITGTTITATGDVDIADKIVHTGDTDTAIRFPAANTVTVETGGSERMRIDSSGNVGIGTSSSITELGFPIGNDIKISQAAGTDHLAGNAGSIGLTIIDGGGHSGVFVNNSHDGTYSDQFITFKTAEGGVSAATERMRIDSSGNVAVGKTTTGDISVIGAELGAAGYVIGSRSSAASMFANRATSTGDVIVVAYNGAVVGTISTNGTSTSYNTSSDYRLKEDVQPMSGASDRLMQLNPVNFAWKVDGSRVDGFLAHEAQEVVPEAVTGEKDGEEMQSIDHSKLVPLLTAALQEALTKIETLEARLNALEGQ